MNLKNPRIFFKQIGLKPLVKSDEEATTYHMEKELIKRRDKEAANVLEKSKEDRTKAFGLYNSHLAFVKIWYGADYNRISGIALELSDLSIPTKSNILDIGGGPGHLAFWMTNIWDASSVTVADMYTDVGAEWAAQINEDRVSFINSLLPDLREIGVRQFDVIVLSRVLSAIKELNLPEGIMGLDIKAFVEAKKACDYFLN